MVQTQTAITNANIGAAATAWATNPTTAAATYGNIADWNTAAVTGLYRLLQPTFNADIGKWNVASVTMMWTAFYQATAFNGNIGSWNTAAVTTLYAVCAAYSARRRATAALRRDALGGSSMRRGPLCAAAPAMRARVCAVVWARACAGVLVCRYRCA